MSKGLVNREGDPTDRRIVLLKITPKAREQFEHFKQEHLSSFAQLFNVLDDEEINQLVTLLDKIETAQTGKDKINVEPDKTP